MKDDEIKKVLSNINERLSYIERSIAEFRRFVEEKNDLQTEFEE